MTKETYLAPRTKTFYGDCIAVKATVTPVLTSKNRISGRLDLDFFNSGISGSIDGNVFDLLRPLVRGIDNPDRIIDSLNGFLAGLYSNPAYRALS
ncbi:MAG: hypothetical protein AABW88_00045 [Nanoarchaeota archaeon]